MPRVPPSFASSSWWESQIKSWSDAAQQAVSRASESTRHITGLDVLRSSAVVRDGKIIEYHVNVKVAFVVEPAKIDS